SGFRPGIETLFQARPIHRRREFIDGAGNLSGREFPAPSLGPEGLSASMDGLARGDANPFQVAPRIRSIVVYLRRFSRGAAASISRAASVHRVSEATFSHHRMGHPLGATSTRLILTLLHELLRRSAVTD